MHRHLLLLLSLLAIVSLVHAHDASKRQLQVGGSAIAVEIADGPQERARGLMFREGLGDGEGMLFVFERDGFHPFWMKNMHFPLDIVWLDSDGRVVYLETNVPPCLGPPCPLYVPMAPARYVLEVSANSARVGLGDMIAWKD